MKKFFETMLSFGTIAGTVTAVVILTVASFSWAKVSDFHSLINDNISAQNELHGEVRKQMKATRESLNPGPASTMVVESDQTQINSPTSKKMLRYKKETASRGVSQKKQMDRLSQEFNDASSSF
jgi:biopolymer transport protein ExbB/TolQ